MLPLPPEMHHSMTLDQHETLRRQMADERAARAAAAPTADTEMVSTVARLPSLRARLATTSIFGWLRARSL